MSIFTKARFFALMLVATVVFRSTGVQAQEERENIHGLRTLIVQNRLHSMSHEFHFSVGVLPIDAFTKGLTFSAAYTLHFNDLLAWEIGQFTYSLGIDSGLKEELANLPQPIGPTPFEVTKFFYTSNFVFKPIYGKLAFLNRSILYGELYAVAGGGYGHLSITNRPVVDLGLGLRLYAGDYLSIRFDIRDYAFLNTEDIHNELMISLGLSIGID